LEKYDEITNLFDLEEGQPIGVATTSDDWPFLYVKPGGQPVGYYFVLGFILLAGAAGVRFSYGKDAFRSGFDVVLFFMGAAFLLIETRGVTSLSLLFGSTWLVNSAIFAGILLMVFLANLYVIRKAPVNLMPWFIALFTATAILYLFDIQWLNNYSLAVRGTIGSLLNALPIGFAGVIVSTLLARSKSPSASLGSNLLGSVVGGCLGYGSMLLGLKSLVILACIFYLLAFLLFKSDARSRITS